MNNLSVFEFDSQEIRFVGGKPVANDVAAVLGYTSLAATVNKKVNSRNKGVAKMETPGGTQEVMVLEEAGIYQLIFGSKLPAAEQFQDWVFEKVLPAIRKTGKYEATPEPVALPPADIRIVEFHKALTGFDIDISNPRYKQAIQDQVLNKILGQPTLPESTERWLGVIEKAEEMGYPIDIVTRFRSALGRFVKSHNLDCRSESRLCNGTQRPINLYRDCAELSEAIAEYMDAKILKVS